MRLTLMLPAMALLLSSCAPTSQTPNITNEMAEGEAALQRELAVKENMAMARKLEDIASPILIANAPLCHNMVEPYLGVHFVTRDAVTKEYQSTMENLYGAGDYPTITIVGKKAPASGVLKVGDMITQVNGTTLPSGKTSLQALQDEIKDSTGALNLTIDRNGKSINKSVKPKMACASPVLLSPKPDVNAFADGKNIHITKGMMRFAENDTQLATVIGHELAHNSREHINAKRGNAVVGGLLGAAVSVAIGVNITDLGAQIGAGANSQGFEAEADYVGLYHTARAGYDINSAPQLWRRMAANNASGIHLAGGSHPSTAKRFLALEATVKEINAKKAKGLPLVPEEQEVQQRQEEVGLNN